MADGKQVIGRFLGRWKPADRSLLAKLGELRGPAGQHLVRIALVADIPQQPIRAGGIGAEVVDVMKGDGQLDDAQVGGQMPAVLETASKMTSRISAAKSVNSGMRKLAQVGGPDRFKQGHHQTSEPFPPTGGSNFPKSYSGHPRSGIRA